MSRTSQPTRLPADVYESATAAARLWSRTVPQQIAYWARIGREIEMSPGVDIRAIGRVLVGADSYDEINEGEQAIVREKWDERAMELREGLDYVAKFTAAGESYSELDDLDYRSAIRDVLGRPIPPKGELRVWLDDDLVDREAPEGWTHVRSVREACFVLLSGRVVELSLDNDLNNACVIDGDSEEEVERRTRLANENLFGTGFQVLDFLEEQHFTCNNPLWPRDGIAIHTANSNARQRMERSIEAVARQDGVELEKVQRPGERPRYKIRVGSQG